VVGFYPYWKFDKNESDERILAWFAQGSVHA